MTGVIIAQLYRIQHASSPSPTIGFYVIGLPLSVTFIGMAIFVLLVGAIRFWRLQNALVRGKALAGGWEITAIMAASALVSRQHARVASKLILCSCWWGLLLWYWLSILTKLRISSVLACYADEYHKVKRTDMLTWIMKSSDRGLLDPHAYLPQYCGCLQCIGVRLRRFDCQDASRTVAICLSTSYREVWLEPCSICTI